MKALYFSPRNVKPNNLPPKRRAARHAFARTAMSDAFGRHGAGVHPHYATFRDREPDPGADMPKAVENWRIIGKITASIVARCVAEDDRDDAA